jgi:hypothetical protein
MALTSNLYCFGSSEMFILFHWNQQMWMLFSYFVKYIPDKNSYKGFDFTNIYWKKLGNKWLLKLWKCVEFTWLWAAWCISEFVCTGKQRWGYQYSRCHGKG